jgi:hypothetical protein
VSSSFFSTTVLAALRALHERCALPFSLLQFSVLALGGRSFAAVTATGADDDAEADAAGTAQITCAVTFAADLAPFWSGVTKVTLQPLPPAGCDAATNGTVSFESVSAEAQPLSGIVGAS